MRLSLQNFLLSLAVILIISNHECYSFRIDTQEYDNVDDNDHFSADYDGDYNEDFIEELRHRMQSNLHDDFEVTDLKITDVTDTEPAEVAPSGQTFSETKTVLSTITNETAAPSAAEASAIQINSNLGTEAAPSTKTDLKTEEESASAIGSNEKIVKENGSQKLKPIEDSQPKQEKTERVLKPTATLTPPNNQQTNQELVQMPSQRSTHFEKLPERVQNKQPIDISKVQTPSNRNLYLDQLPEGVRTQQLKDISNGHLQYKKHEFVPTITLSREDYHKLPAQYIRLVEAPASENVSAAKPRKTLTGSEPRTREFILQPVHNYPGQPKSNYVLRMV